MPSCEGGSHIEGNFQASTISIKPSVLDYHREQVAVKDKERESERKWGERWQMAAELDVSRRKEGRTQQRRDSEERDATPLQLKEIHFNLTSPSRSHKTLIAVENELISNMFSLIHHRTSERGNYFDTVKQAFAGSAAVNVSVQAQNINNLQEE